ncbi:MAG: TetR/AcrR family transcriptional regulator [Acidobacteria bacterium]|nr:TetR/AcrR family transcriptional regulator [Acidobacteriota bacterium]
MTIQKKMPPRRSGAGRKRDSSTYDALLNATVEQLNEGGESEIRLENILAAADCSPSSLYHHFGNLRGLLDEAQIVRFSKVLRQRTEALNAAIQNVRTRDELVSFCSDWIDQLLVGDGPIARSRRVDALGSTYMRLDFAKRMGEAQAESCEQLASAIRVPQLRGLIDESLDLYSVAHWIQGLFFSRVLVELGHDDKLGRAWNELTKRAILATLFESADTTRR